MKNNNLILIISIICLISVPLSATCQNIKTDKKLQKGLSEILSDFNGTAGVYVYNLKTNREA
ncbi:MAG TPA: hypothetical protein VFI78_04455, partial [Salinimicrobium sp.]|nr:hypothetical protein [Salinimicrobium sp.]